MLLHFDGSMFMLDDVPRDCFSQNRNHKSSCCKDDGYEINHMTPSVIPCMCSS